MKSFSTAAAEQYSHGHIGTSEQYSHGHIGTCVSTAMATLVPASVQLWLDCVSTAVAAVRHHAAGCIRHGWDFVRDGRLVSGVAEIASGIVGIARIVGIASGWFAS